MSIDFEDLWEKKDVPRKAPAIEKPPWWDDFKRVGQSGYWQELVDAYKGRLTYSMLAKEIRNQLGTATTSGTVGHWVRGELPDRPFRATLPAMEYCKRLLEDADRARPRNIHNRRVS